MADDSSSTISSEPESPAAAARAVSPAWTPQELADAMALPAYADDRRDATAAAEIEFEASALEASAIETASASATSAFLAAPPAARQQIELLQSQLRDLQFEVNLLRRRDDTLKFYMSRLDEEMRLAARLQQDFLPKTLPHLGRIKFHTLYRPAGYVSGDFYDVMRLDEHNVGFLLVDAVGHGMPAALLTMFLKRALITKEILSAASAAATGNAAGYRLLPPQETIALLNDALCEQNLSSATFATALYGTVNVHTLDVSIACAGHPPPMLLRDGTFEPLGATGGLLGIFPGETYDCCCAQLRTGDRLLIYSDGVEVAFSDEDSTDGNAKGPDTERWRGEIQRRHAMSAEELLMDFSRQLDEETGSLTPRDDLTMVMLEVTEASVQGEA